MRDGQKVFKIPGEQDYFVDVGQHVVRVSEIRWVNFWKDDGGEGCLVSFRGEGRDGNLELTTEEGRKLAEGLWFVAGMTRG